MSIQQLFETILKITGYPEKDRKEQVEALLSLAAQHALLLYIEKVSEEKRKEIKKLLEDNAKEKVEELCKAYMEEAAYKKLFAQEADRILGEYIKDMTPDLTEKQIAKLEGLLEKSA